VKNDSGGEAGEAGGEIEGAFLKRRESDMATRLAGVIAIAVSVCGVGAAQESKRPTVSINAEIFNLTPGDPLSARALVTRPRPITGVVSWSLETRRHRGTFWCQALSPDGKALATGGLDGTIRIWDIETGRLIRALIGHSSYVYGLDWSPDGRTLASAGSFDATVRLWDAATGRPLRVLRGHPSWTVGVKWSADGREILAGGGESGPFTHWQAVSGLKRATVELGKSVTSLSWHPEGKSAAVVAQAIALSIWDADKRKVLRTFGAAADGYLCCAWSPDGKTLAAGTNKDTLLYDEAGKLINKLEGAGSCVVWSVDGKQLFVLSGPAIKVWDATGKLLHTVPAPGASLFSVTPDDRFCVTGDGTAFTVHEVSTGKVLRRFDIAGTVPPFWWPGRPLVTGIGTPKLSLWDQATGKLLRTLEGHTSSILSATYSPEGKTLATASYDKTVKVWETASGKAVHTFSGHTAHVLTAAFSANGKLIASSGGDKLLLVWDVKSGKVLHTFKEPTSEAPALAWAPGSSVSLAAGDREGLVRIWSTRGTKAKTTLKGITEIVSLAWSPDGSQVAGGQADHRLQVWDALSGKKLLTLEEAGSPPAVTAIAWSPNGQILAGGRGNHTMQLWNPRTGKKLFSLQQMAPVYRVAWTPNGNTVVCSNADRTARFTDPATGEPRGVLLAEEKQILAVSFDGYYHAPDPEPELVYVVQTSRSQETYSPSAFASKYKWKNVPTRVKLTAK
jgi:WD40 repeat protein